MIYKVLKIYNIVLLPLVAILFIILFIAVRIANSYLLYATIVLIIASPFIAYFVARRLIT